MSMDQASDQFSVGNVFRASKCWLTVEVTFQDAIDYSFALFQELNMQYEQLVAKFDSSIQARQDGSHFDFLFPVADFLLLLRNCLAIFPFLEFGDSSLLAKHGIIVFSILGSLCSSDLWSKASRHKIQDGVSFSRETPYASMCFPDGSARQEPVDPAISFPEKIVSRSSFLCSVVEVFLNELLICQDLRHSLLTAERVCSAKNIFMSHLSIEDSMLEVVSAHFLMSVCDEWAFEKFHNTLFWSYRTLAEIPQLSLAATMTFLGNLAVATAPKIFQAHLVSLVSSCIGISMPGCGQMTPLLLSTYVSAFEESVILYDKQMLLLLGNDHSLGVSRQSVCQIEPFSTFESHVTPETYAEINLQISKLLNAFQQHFRDAVSESRSDLMSASMTYVNESQLVLDEKCRVEACAILNCIIQRSLVEEIEVKASDKSGEISQHDVFLLASILKLMSCSLLQIIRYMQKSLKFGSSKVLRDPYLCQEYGFLIGIIKRFERYSINRSIQKTLKDVMDSSPVKHKESKFILIHFAGLLSFCFDRRLGFLWKGCLFMLMTVMNLFMLEEGNLDALKPLLCYVEKPSVYVSCLGKLSELKLLLVHSEEPSCSKSCLTSISKDLKCQRSSRLVASNWQKIQMVYMKKCNFDTGDLIKKDDSGSDFSGAQDALHGTLRNALDNVMMEENNCIVQNEDETCNREDFLKCRGVSLDQDGDLADFIDCKPQKDYHAWWKRRQQYRVWLCQLRASKQKMRRKVRGHGKRDKGTWHGNTNYRHQSRK